MFEKLKSPETNTINKNRLRRLAAVIGIAILPTAVSCSPDWPGETQGIAECKESFALTDVGSDKPVEDADVEASKAKKRIETLHSRALQAENKQITLVDEHVGDKDQQDFTVVAGNDHLSLVYGSYFWNELWVQDTVVFPAGEQPTEVSPGAVVCLDNGELYPNRVNSSLALAVELTDSFD